MSYKTVSKKTMLSALWVASIGVVSANCVSPDVEISVLGLIANTCSGDEECATGQVCDSTYEICVASSKQPIELALVVTPPSQSDAVPAHQANVMFTPGEPLQVTLPDTVLYSGNINIAGNYLEPSSVPAMVLAVATTDIVPGLYRSASAVANGDGFELKLEAGVEYQVNIRADDRTRPTYSKLVKLEADTYVEITLPELESLPHITGRIMQAEESLNRPLGNVAVTAVETTTNARCASTTTDMLGAYDIACPTAGVYVLRVSPAPDGPAIPRFDALFDGKTEINVEQSTTLPPLVLPLQTRTTTVSLEVNGANAITGLEGVDVTLAATIEDTAVWTNAVYVVQGSTNEGGDIDLVVIPGEYEVGVMPSTLTPHGAYQDTLVVGDSPVSLKVDLEPKPVLRGMVRSRGGTTVPRAQVEALMKMTDPGTGAVGTREYSVHADDTGYYELLIDKGEITLNVLPADDSALPRWSDAAVEIYEDTTLDIELPAAQVLTGQVTGTSLEQADGISVELYRTDGADVLHLLARGYTTNTGHFMIVLPAP